MAKCHEDIKSARHQIKHPEEVGPHLVAWEDICKSKWKGGLGIRRITEVNKAHSFKWLWLFGEEQGSL